MILPNATTDSYVKLQNGVPQYYFACAKVAFASVDTF